LEAWWVTLLRRQQSDGFPDFAGAAGAITLPISDRLITRVIADRLPPSVPVRDLDLHAHADGIIDVRLRLTKPAFLPPLRLRFAIVQQPDLPASPVVALAMVSEGLTRMAAQALKFVDVLPRGVRFDGHRFFVDLAALLQTYDAADVLRYLTDLNFSAEDGRIIVRARAAVAG